MNAIELTKIINFMKGQELDLNDFEDYFKLRYNEDIKGKQIEKSSTKIKEKNSKGEDKEIEYEKITYTYNYNNVQFIVKYATNLGVKKQDKVPYIIEDVEIKYLVEGV